MSSTKMPMSTSYKAVFVLSLLMIFVVIIGGAMSGSKSIGFGIWYWGYTAWKMYKRDNDALVSLQKIMLWFQAVAFSIALAVLLFSDSDVKRYVDVTPLGLILIATVSIGITYFLYKFFFNQSQTHPTSINAETNFSNNDMSLWEKVSEELKGDVRIDSLWTRAYAEADGDVSKANARYIKLRIDQLSKSQSKNTSASKERLLTSAVIRKSSSSRVIVVGLGLTSLVLIGLITYKSKSSFSPERSSFDSYLGISLNSSMDEVKYALGVPSEVLFKDDKPFKLADGTTIKDSLVVATKDEIRAKNGVNNFFYWQYNLPEYRIDVSFDSNLKKVISIGCYVANSSSYKPKNCEIGGFNVKADEASILEKLGKPERDEINGVTKTLFYNQLNLQLIFEKKQLYYIIVGAPNKDLSPTVTSKPSYDDIGWTQESTGSKEIGPWLKYSPPGTRYCRYSDGIIQRLYPPGVKPNAEKANPFCLGDSTASP
jgi:hypothetical protein